MLSHPYGVVTLWEFGYPVLRSDAANERRAASVQPSAPARFAWLRTASRVATSWLRSPTPHKRGVPWGRTAPSLASDYARVD
jgi:hypothetical protein